MTLIPNSPARWYAVLLIVVLSAMIGCTEDAATPVVPKPFAPAATKPAPVSATIVDDPIDDETANTLNASTQRQSPELVSDGLAFQLSFDDLAFDIEVGEPFERTMLTPEIESYDEHDVRIRGYIRPSYRQSGLPGFIFVRDNKECCFGPQAAIYDSIVVRLTRGTTAEYTARPVTIEGELFLDEYEGPDGTTWCIYQMRNAKVL